MNVLLDTQAFLWLDSDQAKLSKRAKQVCSDTGNALWLSVASAWEMQIKIGLGKLRLQQPLAEIISTQRRVNGIQVLGIELPHALELANLPPHHKDPFDRLLIAQARCSDWDIISKDSEFARYQVRVIW